MTDYDAQPSRPFPHRGGARPVPPTREFVSQCTLELEVPTDEEREAGKRAIAELQKMLRERELRVSAVEPDRKYL